MHPAVKCGVNQKPPCLTAGLRSCFASQDAVCFCVQMQADCCSSEDRSDGNAKPVTEVAASSACRLHVCQCTSHSTFCAHGPREMPISVCGYMQAFEDGKAVHAVAGMQPVEGHVPRPLAQVQSRSLSMPWSKSASCRAPVQFRPCYEE
jgi:hypothetical protein